MIRVGIGGWNYEPWRGTFFPKKLSKTKALHHASRRGTSIEVNSTFYGTFNSKTFGKWFDETPDDFIFSLKAPRFAVSRRILGEAGPAIAKFFESGVSELKSKLGPILWQLPPFKEYDADDIEAFLSLLPKSIEGRKLRHVLEVRYESFQTQDFILQARKANVGIVLADAPKYPLIADLTSDFVYLRLQVANAEIETGYSAEDLHRWTELACAWQKGEEPEEFPLFAPRGNPHNTRDVFVYFINGAKERAPAAAEATISFLSK